MTTRFRSVRVAVLVAALAVDAHAAPLFYHFDVDFTSGPLTGQIFPGLITIDGNDCPGNICNGAFSPDPPNVAKSLLGLDITVDGIAFDMTRDTGFSIYPQVTFVNGNVTFIDYDGIANQSELQLKFQGNATFTPATGPDDSSNGTVVAAAVPEPATLALLGLGLGLAGLGFSRRKQ